jgi:hypothetical protein
MLHRMKSNKLGKNMEVFYSLCSEPLLGKYFVRILAPISITATFFSSLYIDMLGQLLEIYHGVTHS